MKTRNGFVSNSSSSSFVIFGVKFEKDSLLKKKFYNENNDIYPKNKKLLPKDTICRDFEEIGYVLGWKIGGGDDTCFDMQDITIEQLQEYSEKFEKATGIKPKLFGGIQYS